MDNSAKRERVAIIGGTSGIGLATARQLVTKGYAVTITGRNQEKLSRALASLGDGANGTSGDAGDVGFLRGLLGRSKPIHHVVIAAANHGGAKPFKDVTPEDVMAGIEKKLIVHVMAAREAHAVLQAKGSITFISAVSARMPSPGAAVLSAINGAIASMVPSLASEMAPTRVNAVLPGVIDTGWWDWLPEDTRRATFERYAKATPVGRIGRPEDVADAIVFLIGNSFTTGALLPCDGGLQLVAGRT